MFTYLHWKKIRNNNYVRALNPDLDRWIKLLWTLYEPGGRQTETRAALARSLCYADKMFVRVCRLEFYMKKNALCPCRAGLPYLPIILSKLVNFSVGNISLLQPNLNFMFFSSKALPWPLLHCLKFYRQILPSLGDGTVHSWYRTTSKTSGLNQDVQVWHYLESLF